MLTRHPYLLTDAEAQAEISKSSPVITIIEPVGSRISQAALNSLIEKKVGERNYTATNTNRRSVKRFALDVSKAKKPGRKWRVGSEHLKWVEAELENIIQGICRNPHSEDDLKVEYDFLNWKKVGPRVREVLNRAVRRAIFSRVKNHPSTGKTLK